MNALHNRIADEIPAGGAIPFARFMELALYAPGHGYYEKSLNQIGRRGDFITSVSVGPLFGELLAFQFSRWLAPLQEPGQPLQIVEAGAHTGQLAADVLAALRASSPTLHQSLQYWIVEPSPARREVQQAQLAAFDNVRWFAELAALPSPVRGVIFSNELLDAFPVHPCAWNSSRRRWEERGVALDGDAFTWTQLPEPSLPPPDFPEALLDVLPDGYTVELAPSATRWWREAAMALSHGRLMTIDYGGVLEELLNPGRTRGTLRAYSRHRVSGDVLADPGEQDLTAHVNFTEVRSAGEAAGLQTEAFTTQGRFLTLIARELWTERGSWPPEQVRQFQTLTHPEHLGRPFRVLVQSR